MLTIVSMLANGFRLVAASFRACGTQIIFGGINKYIFTAHAMVVRHDRQNHGTNSMKC